MKKFNDIFRQWDGKKVSRHLYTHVHELTVNIGTRCIATPESLKKAEEYIKKTFDSLGLSWTEQECRYGGLRSSNIIVPIKFVPSPARTYIICAHYDTVCTTPGADDNGSALAVLLEVGRFLSEWRGRENLDLEVKLIAFTLEEPPVFHTGKQGSRIYARRARKERERIDGVLCLEMVGYFRDEEGSQSYPLPFVFRRFPKKGNFITVVGNWRSKEITGSIVAAFKKNPGLPVEYFNIIGKGWMMLPLRFSDHASFWDYGYKAVMITDTAFYRNPHYHSQGDRIETLNFPVMAEVVKSLLLFLSQERFRQK